MTIDEAREILEKLIPQPQRGDGKSITHLMITEALTMAIKVLEQEPKPNWIPVSERLPEVGKKILVTSYGRVCYAVMISTDGNSGYPIFRLQDSLNERTVCETIAHNDMTSNRIIAWMPLPEPYVPDINVGKMAESEE